MLKEAVAILSPKDGMDYLDCTFGGGGHSRAILESANCRVTAVDRDPAAAERAAELKKYFLNASILSARISRKFANYKPIKDTPEYYSISAYPPSNLTRLRADSPL